MRYFEDCRECAYSEISTAGRNQRMNIDHGLAPVEFLPYRLVRRVAEPLVAIVGLQADAIRLQRIEGIFDFLQRAVGVEAKTWVARALPAAGSTPARHAQSVWRPAPW